jgi:amino acid adenylation domain-containing protein
MYLRGRLLQDYLTDSVHRLPKKIALVCAQDRWDYEQLEHKSNAIADTLRNNGILRGERVVIFAENGMAAVCAFWAVLKVDAVVCLISPQSPPSKIRYYLNDSRASALITTPELNSTLTRILVSEEYLRVVILVDKTSQFLTKIQTIEDTSCALSNFVGSRDKNLDIDLAAIIYTSGSTGIPKGVMLSHRNMRAACESINCYLGNQEDDVILAALPLCFDYGLYQMIMAISIGATLILERSFTLLPQVLARAEREGVTALPGVPSIFSLLAEFPVPALPKLRYITSTGSALAPKHIAILKKYFPHAEIFSMYGLTECKRCSYLPPKDLTLKPDSVGIAIPGNEFWVVDHEDKRLGANEVGELVIRGSTVMLGYWGKTEQTTKKLRPGLLPSEHILYTGDLCHIDKDGYLYFIERKDNIIKSRGEKIAPREVELALLAISGVKEAAVVGVPDEIWGHVASAFITLEPATILSSEEILTECRRRLEPVQVPKYLHVLETLPLTDNGKIDKATLNSSAFNTPNSRVVRAT